MKALNQDNRKLSIVLLLVGALALAGAALAFSRGLSLTGGQSTAASITSPISSRVTAMNALDDGTLILGHQDGQTLAMDSRQTVLWSYQTGGSILDIEAANGRVYIASDDRLVHVLDSAGQLIRQLPSVYRPVSVSAAEEGGLVAIGSSLMSFDRNRIQAYDEMGKETALVTPSSIIKYVFVTDQNNIISLEVTTQIQLLNAQGGLIKAVPMEGTTAAAAYQAQANLLAVADSYGNLTVYDEALQVLWTQADTELMDSLAFLSMDGAVAGIDRTGKITMFDHTGQPQFTMETQEVSASLASSVNEHHLYLLNSAGEIASYGDAQALLNISQGKSNARLLFVLAGILAFAAIICLLLLIPGARSKLRRTLKAMYRSRISYGMIFPSILLLLVFSYVPILQGLAIAFTDYQPGRVTNFVGLENFRSMVGNEYFWFGVRNMVVFLVTDILKAIIASLLFAELIFALRSRKAQYWTRVLLFLPGVVPGIATLLIWTNGLLNMDGLFNSILNAIGLGALAKPWLGTETTAIWALVAIGFPWIGSYIILYGALNALSDSVIEAAKIDGCGWLKRIWLIDIPLLKPQLRFILIGTIVGSVQNFGLVHATTGGGPGYATYTPILELYFNMARFQNYGVAAAMGLALFVLIFVSTVVIMRLLSTAEME